MLKSYMHNQVRKFAGEFGYDADYFHELIDAAPMAALKFQLFQFMAKHRDHVPADAWYAAHLAGVLCEDCGPCTQLCIDMAIKEGVAPAKMAALIRGDIEQAGPDAALAFRYGVAVATNADTLDLVERVKGRFGERGLISLCFSVTGARVYPSLKRGLGHGAACSRVTVRGETIAVYHPESGVSPAFAPAGE